MCCFYLTAADHGLIHEATRYAAGFEGWSRDEERRSFAAFDNLGDGAHREVPRRIRCAGLGRVASGRTT
jgi:hypothetical protein